MTMQDINLDVVAGECYAAVVSDCCDAIGLRHQTLDPAIRPVAPSMSVLVGWARPVLSVAVESGPARPYGAEIDFIDSLKQGQVVMGRCEINAAFWDELFSTAARVRGTRGVDINEDLMAATALWRPAVEDSDTLVRDGLKFLRSKGTKYQLLK